ncbi:glutathione S-transferase [Gigaspora margarita]|uniref:glutathione transferase n=1 Tax=Gigaspora margarita TaxID=4874 RepID=A0A8H3XKV9_GIGMA|nr:glutathione S-transferase [Gigaspora margarita]
MTIRLIGYSFSGIVMRVIICLKELCIPYELDPPASYKSLKDEDYIANKHPFGKIPVLFDGDFKITESRAICRYLASKYQGKHNDTILIPNNIHKARLVDQFISYELSYYDPPLSKLIYQEKVIKSLNRDQDPEVIKQAHEELAKVLDVFEKLLEGKEYLNGEYSLADLFLCPSTYYVYDAGHSDLWDNRPNVKKWWNRLYNRDAVKKSFEDTKSFWESNPKF